MQNSKFKIVWFERYKNEKLFEREKIKGSTNLDAI
jgi:hypothetical protein